MEIILLIVGFVVLIKGADYLVEGSSSIAKRMGVSSLTIGLTIVAFGTSMPELVVNIISSFQDKGGVAFGNIIGSNLANILLVLGLTAIIRPIDLQNSTVWKEIPFSLLAAIVLFIIVNSKTINFLSFNDVTGLTRTDGIIMLLFFVIFLIYVFEMGKNKHIFEDQPKVDVEKHSTRTSVIYIILGIVSLYFGGRWVISGAVYIAGVLNISEFMISAIVIAIGTSLPELITSVVAAMKNDLDMAVGNIIGSNIFNILWVLGFTAVISPLSTPFSINPDIAFLLIITFILFMFMFIGKRHELERWQGAFFLILYVAYISFIVFRG